MNSTFLKQVSQSARFSVGGEVKRGDHIGSVIKRVKHIVLPA